MQWTSYYLRLFVIPLMLFCCAAQAQTALIQRLLHQAGDPVGGHPQGAITLVEFFDYQCDYCRNMVPIIARIIRDNPDVRLVFKEYPIRGPLSETAARAALAAHKQGQYLAFNHALFASSPPLTIHRLFAIAKTCHLRLPQLRREMVSRTISAQLAANNELAQLLHVNGTPTFYVGKTHAADLNDFVVLFGETDQASLQRIINQIRKS